MSEPQLYGWTLRGRDDELSATARALAGGVAMVDVTGLEGVGRTRLLAEVGTAAGACGRRTEPLTAVASAGAMALAPLLPAPDGAPTELARAMLAALESRPSPPVVLLDDAHLLDPVSADVLLLALTRGLAQLVLTRRTDAVVSPGVERLLSVEAADVNLRPLGEGPMSDLLRQALHHVDPLSARRLMERAEGRPAWLRVLLRAGLGSGALSATSGVWSWAAPRAGEGEPDTGGEPSGAVPGLRAAFAAGLRPLTPGALRTVELVALAGSLTLVELAAVADPPTVQEALASRAVTLRISRRRRSVQLTHSLDGDRLLDAMSDAARAELGAELLACVARSPGRRADDPLRAVLPAVELGAEVPVAGLLEAARVLRPRDPAGTEPLARAALAASKDDSERALARWLLADALEKTGRHAAAVTVLAEGHPPHDDAGAAFHTVQVRSNALWAGARADDERAREELAGADLDADGGDELVAIACWMHAFPGAAAEAVALSRALLGDQRCGDRAAVWATTALVLALAVLGRADEVPAALAPARSAAARLPDEPYAQDQLGWVEVFSHVLAGQVNSALDRASDGYARARLGSDPVRVGAWASVRGLAAGAAGQLDAADGFLRETQALLDPTSTGGAYGAGALATSHRAFLHAQRGRFDLSRAAAEEAGRLSVLNDPGMALFSVWLVRDAAWAGVATVRQLLDAVRACATTLPAVALSGAVDALRLGAWREALPLLRELAPRVAGPAGQGWQLAAQALSRPGAQGVEAAVDVLALAGAPLLGAELLELAASRRDPVEAARARLRRDGLLSLAGPASTPLLRAGATGLTRREQEVADLAAWGMTSRQIGELLSVSVRTVDNHLGRAYVKLGVHDRTGLTAVLGG